MGVPLGFELLPGAVFGVELLDELSGELLLVPPEELPGLSAPPVAEAPLERPKYEKTLCRQLGCIRSVF